MTTKTPKRLVRGSIRVFKDACFYKERDVQQMVLSHKDTDAILKVTSIPKDVQELFNVCGITIKPETRIACRLHNEIEGLQVDEIIQDDEDYLRLKFSGLTEKDLQSKLQKATEWLDVKKIIHGEFDGKAACIFKCLTSEQLKMGDF